MTDIRAKVAYLQGLAEGLDIDQSSAEGRVLSSMIDVLGDIAEEMATVGEVQEELAQYVEDVDYDLGALEEAVYADDDEDSEEIYFVPEDALVQEEDGVELLSCPECGETVAAGSGELDVEFEGICPTCGCAVIDAGLDYDEDRVLEHD